VPAEVLKTLVTAPCEVAVAEALSDLRDGDLEPTWSIECAPVSGSAPDSGTFGRKALLPMR
jgi:hypothetical protein